MGKHKANQGLKNEKKKEKRARSRADEKWGLKQDSESDSGFSSGSHSGHCEALFFLRSAVIGWGLEDKSGITRVIDRIRMHTQTELTPMNGRICACGLKEGNISGTWHGHVRREMLEVWAKNFLRLAGEVLGEELVRRIDQQGLIQDDGIIE